MNQESIQQKIQVARRDAEALKDRIKRKKDELADTTRTSCTAAVCLRAMQSPPVQYRLVLCTANRPLQSAMSPATVSRPCRASP